MRISRALMMVAATAFALGLNVYLVMHALMSKGSAGQKLASEECVNPDTAAPSQTNPNKLLFISCGGFID